MSALLDSVEGDGQAPCPDRPAHRTPLPTTPRLRLAAAWTGLAAML
jgi:hypothetical protein